MSQKVWFITGASRGFGRIWAEAALKRGDKVAIGRTEVWPRMFTRHYRELLAQ